MRVFTIFPPIHRKNIYAPELRELLSSGQVKPLNFLDRFPLLTIATRQCGLQNYVPEIVK